VQTVQNFKTKKDITIAKTSELVDFYNANCGTKPQIKKFRDRATAERRVAELMEQRAGKLVTPCAPPTSEPKKKTYLGIVRDHSKSMHAIKDGAKNDYNQLIAAAKKAALDHNIETVVTVVVCGASSNTGFSVAEKLVNVHDLEPLTAYHTNGSCTPLFSSIGQLIEIFNTVSDRDDPNVNFVIVATTDGESNAGLSGSSFSSIMAALVATDKWTFGLRVPKGCAANQIRRAGFHAGNILEWETTAKGIEKSTAVNTAAVSEFFKNRAAGVNSTKTFYTSLKGVKESVITSMLNISNEVVLIPVGPESNGCEIRDFVQARLNAPMVRGCAFYQLTKTENKIQWHKLIVIRHKDTGALYFGSDARTLLGLPLLSDARVCPSDHGNFDVFVQSTSVNRKLKSGTHVMYWAGAAKIKT
jgi:hypothetical protein